MAIKSGSGGIFQKPSVFQGKALLSNPFLLAGMMSLAEVGRVWECVDQKTRALRSMKAKLRLNVVRMQLRQAKDQASQARMEAEQARAACQAIEQKYMLRNRKQTAGVLQQLNALPKTMFEQPMRFLKEKCAVIPAAIHKMQSRQDARSRFEGLASLVG